MPPPSSGGLGSFLPFQIRREAASEYWRKIDFQNHRLSRSNNGFVNQVIQQWQRNCSQSILRTKKGPRHLRRRPWPHNPDEALETECQTDNLSGYFMLLGNSRKLGPSLRLN